jgi:hypothetical protein
MFPPAMVPTFNSLATRMAILLAGMIGLAGCTSDRLFGPGSDSGSAVAAAPAAPARMPPPVDLGGRWVFASPNAGFCNMTFGNAPGASEGTIAPEGGCPGNFFTSRKWTFETGGLVLRDHTGQPLARLATTSPGRFEGESTSGQTVSLTR